MFDFIRKPGLWDALDRGWLIDLGGKLPFSLKTIQDLAVYRYLSDSRGLDIAEIGGGDSRLLRAIAPRNRCVNIDKFEGADNGPRKEVKIRNVRNVRAFLGEFDPLLEDESFDVVFSISVVEHLPTADLANFLKDGLRILRRGGLWVYAIDIYLDDDAPTSAARRFEIYKSWTRGDGALDPVGPVFEGPLRFTCDMATNPDHIMHEWGKIAPKLIECRQRSQLVSLLVAAKKN